MSSTKPSASDLKYRKKAGRGKIMKPSTFASIEAKAKAEGATNPQAVAGAAYWRTLKAKHKHSMAKRGH